MWRNAKFLGMKPWNTVQRTVTTGLLNGKRKGKVFSCPRNLSFLTASSDGGEMLNSHPGRIKSGKTVVPIEQVANWASFNIS